MIVNAVKAATDSKALTKHIWSLRKNIKRNIYSISYRNLFIIIQPEHYLNI